MQRGDNDVNPRQEDSEGILDRCCAIVPSLREAEVVTVWVSWLGQSCFCSCPIEHRLIGLQPAELSEKWLALDSRSACANELLHGSLWHGISEPWPMQTAGGASPMPALSQS